MSGRAGDGRRGRKGGARKSIFRALISDPWRKLAAVGLAILLWTYLDTQVTDTAELVLDLKVVDEQDVIQTIGDSDLAVQVPTAKVTVLGFANAALENSRVRRVILRFRGPRALIAEVREGTPVRVRRFPEISTANGPLSFQFTAADLRLKTDLQPLLQGMTPQRVVVELSRNETRTVSLDLNRVEVDLTQVSESDRESALRNRARFYPDTVTLTGPELALRQVEQGAALFRAVMRPKVRGSERFLRGTIALAPGARDGLRLTSQSTLDMPLQPTQEVFETIGVLQLDGMALPETDRARYRIRLDSNTTGTGADAIGTFVASGEGAEIPVRLAVNKFGSLHQLLIGVEERGREALNAWGRRHVRLDVVLPEGHDTDAATFDAQLRLVLLDDTAPPDSFGLARKIPVLVERTDAPDGG